MAPSRRALVFRDDELGHLAELLHWGFMPSWADNQAQKPINARVESAASKPYFRNAWKSGRCLIPADGWYEWKIVAGSKQLYFFHRADEQPILMAGLYETNSHVNVTSFAILTTASSGALRELHDRMPLVLSAETAKEWIRRDLMAEDINALANNPLPVDQLAYYAVSTKVNNARNDGVELVEKIQ